MPKRQKATKATNSQRTRKTAARAKHTGKAKTSALGTSPVSRGSAPQERVTKAAQILALLKQPGGATLQDIVSATGWQAHSVRGFVSGQLTKKMKLRVKSLRRDGERVYALKS